MDLLFIVVTLLGILLIISAFIGCVIPAIPGPPLGYLAIILLKLVDSSTFSSDFLLLLGIITIFIFVLDYLLPIWGAKIYNASKKGIWFSIIGMIIGIFFFPPFGMIIGLLIGAIIGELLSGKAKSEALKVGFASFIFSLLAIFIKIVLVGVIAFYFSTAVFKHFI